MVGFARTPAPASCCRDFGRRPLLTSAVPHSCWRGAPSVDLPGTRGVACLLHLCPYMCWCAWLHVHDAKPRFGLKWAHCTAQPLTTVYLLLCPCVLSPQPSRPRRAGSSPKSRLQVLLVLLPRCWPWWHCAHPPTFARHIQPPWGWSKRVRVRAGVSTAA